jgi:hypothetical protein
VLIKWWLLAIPHYLVLGLIGTGLMLGFGAAWSAPAVAFGGLIGLLVFFVGVGLLFQGRYPHGLFPLLMGLNRWVYRVLAYAALMTDDYPPFRLDQGGNDTPGPTTEAARAGIDSGPTPASGRAVPGD